MKRLIPNNLTILGLVLVVLALLPPSDAVPRPDDPPQPDTPVVQPNTIEVSFKEPRALLLSERAELNAVLSDTDVRAKLDDSFYRNWRYWDDEVYTANAPPEFIELLSLAEGHAPPLLILAVNGRAVVKSIDPTKESVLEAIDKGVQACL